MRVYHFVNKQYGLEDIEKRRLKVARIMDLNDPFELLALELSDKGERKKILKQKESIAEKWGILCFSKKWSNSVQWSHYADNHKGICLGFDVPDSHLEHVEYSSKRLIQKKQEFLSGKSIEQGNVPRYFRTKFSHWRYEQEVRWFIKLESIVPDINGLYFKDFSDDLVLKQVIVGSRSSISRARLGSALNGYSVEMFKSRPAFKSFRVVRNQNEKLWK